MNNLPGQIPRLRRDRFVNEAINEVRVENRREMGGGLGVGAVNRVQNVGHLNKVQGGDEKIDAVDRWHAMAVSKICVQPRATFAPAIKIPRNIAGNKVLCDQIV